MFILSAYHNHTTNHTHPSHPKNIKIISNTKLFNETGYTSYESDGSIWFNRIILILYIKMILF
jgi:ABC-type transport system involved in multi-copper enzyme maturation permease subunit